MKILVLNGSPAGQNSITLQTVNYIAKFFPEHRFDVLHVGQRIKSMEKDFSACAEALAGADLILFCYPVYTFLAPAQLHRFIELMKEKGPDLTGKFAAQITTSKHFYDVTAHRFIEDNCRDLGLACLQGLSADMDDLLTEKGREQALDWFRFLLWQMKKPAAEPPRKQQTGRVVIVTDAARDDTELQALIGRFIARLPRPADVVNLREFTFSGGCLGCFRCAADGTCVYKDGFDTFLRTRIQTADATVYAYRIQDHSMGSLFKTYDDRQFCNGHRTVTMGKPVAYLVAGDLAAEPNLQLLMEARAQVGGNFLAGIAAGPDAPAAAERTADTLEYAILHRLSLPQNFYGVGGLKIFRDLIYQMQGLMREDHRFYRSHGFYDDFPQKKKGRIAAMYLVGGMMKSKNLRRKMGNKMTEGMMLPYKKVLEKAEKRAAEAKKD
ncbi:MAG: NAD(P)H-dependent oxidoreductase [Lachnospiraceae bacterium]|nr:NAD(P)H-dependent oxidoreductase [Lachnospiraceae bacterium]